MAYANPAAMSATDGSTAPNVTEPGWPTTVDGALVTLAVGGTLLIVSVVAAVDTCAPDVTRSEIARGPAGPSPSPSAARVAADTVGVGPVASSNCPSPSTSHANESGVPRLPEP